MPVQYGRQFKSWLADKRRQYHEVIPETHIGCGRIKQVGVTLCNISNVTASHVTLPRRTQINLRRLSALHVRCFMKKLHKRHNLEGYNEIMKNPKAKLNYAHIHPHELLDAVIQNGDEVAERQYLSMIRG